MNQSKDLRAEAAKIRHEVSPDLQGFAVDRLEGPRSVVDQVVRAKLVRGVKAADGISRPFLGYYTNLAIPHLHWANLSDAKLPGCDLHNALYYTNAGLDDREIENMEYYTSPASLKITYQDKLKMLSRMRQDVWLFAQKDPYIKMINDVLTIKFDGDSDVKHDFIDGLDIAHARLTLHALCRSDCPDRKYLIDYLKTYGDPQFKEPVDIALTKPGLPSGLRKLNRRKS